MMYRLIRWLLHKFNYELVSFAEMERMKRIIEGRIERVNLGKKSKYHYDYFSQKFNVYSEIENCRIVVKSFYIEDYGSEEYARACAQELCDKLNETP